MKSNINRKSLAQQDLTLLVTIAKVMLHVQVAITILEVTKQISKYQNLAQFQAQLIFIFMEEKHFRQEQEQREINAKKMGSVCIIPIADNEPPEIINCPQTIYAYTDKLSQTAVVTWTQPTATDNSGSVTVSQTRGGISGSNFRLGLTEIRYRATDANGNNSPECIFFVNVEGMKCLFHLVYTQCMENWMVVDIEENVP